MFKNSKGRFQPRWRHRQKCFTSLHNPKKDNNQIKNKNQLQLPGNPTAKNQGVKETFIQIGRVGDRGREDTARQGGRPSRQSHILAQISWEEQTGSKTDGATQGFSTGN